MMAAVPINKESVEIRSKEESTPRTLNEEGQKELQKKAFESIQDNDKITRTQLSENLKVSMYAVKKAIAALERTVSIAAFCRICYKLPKPFQYLLQQMLL